MAGHRPFSELRRELENKLKGTKVENEEQNYLLAWNSSGTAMTATEIAIRQREGFASLHMAQAKFVNEVERRLVEAMGLQASPIDLSAIYRACKAIMQAGYEPRDFSIVIPARDFCQLLNDLAFKINGDPDGTSTMRVHDMEILRGERDIVVYCPHYMVQPDREAMKAEILRCLGRDTVRELPEGTGGNGVSPRAKPVSEVGIAPRPASGDDRNPNSLAHLSDEAKVIAAKEAIAAYARKKQLPSAAHLALFGELDGKRAGNKRPGLGQAGWMPAPAWHAQIDRLFDDIHRNHHGLASEPLGRAIDQIWVRENGGSYADLISSRSERLAEMVNRGDSAADGERG